MTAVIEVAELDAGYGDLAVASLLPPLAGSITVPDS